METFTLNGYLFYSGFDSGNLARVEASPLRTTAAEEAEQEAKENESNTSPASVDVEPRSFQLWTRPDCAGTEFENGNRTWFFFGVRHDPAAPKSQAGFTSEVTLTLRNLNKQSKLFSQGMAPVVCKAPAKGATPLPLPPKSASWERIRDRPTYSTEEGQFCTTFKVKVEPKTVTFVAFTYPYTYKELQVCLGKLERKHGGLAKASHSELASASPNAVYFVRECLTKSLEDRRVDLLTITSAQGALPEREEVPAPGLFPSKDSPGPRPFKFHSKKRTIFISARVHPGETQASFVFNGFLRFLLRENDPRAQTLRSKFVFKLVPMLNPDGVVKGHYRTDSRGVNLNRVYGDPSPTIHPTIYAAKKLLLYAHNCYKIVSEEEETSAASTAAGVASSSGDEQQQAESSSSSLVSSLRVLRSSLGEEPNVASASMSSSGASSSNALSPIKLDPAAAQSSTNWYEMTETSRCSEGDESIADFSVPSCGLGPPPCQQPVQGSPKFGGSSSSSPSPQKSRISFAGAFGGHSTPLEAKRRVDLPPPPGVPPPPLPTSELEDSDNASFDAASFARRLNKASEQQQRQHKLFSPSSASPSFISGLFLYVDIHGHASKRGIFMYGNHFREMDTKVDSMLLPKLMSLNCANFDFPACNFTERNMFLKDRHTGAGREGCGRVGCFKATGLVYSYTLEANFNTGRVVNTVATASRDAGRATPPPIYDLPPKYDPTIYEDSGKAMAVSILDLTESNPWTRLTSSPCKNLKGVKDAIRKHIRAGEEMAKNSAAGAGAPAKVQSPRRTSRRAKAAAGSKTPPAPATGATPKRASKGAAKLPLKAPSSPDSYRPVSKIPRKNSTSSKHSQQGVATMVSEGVAPRPTRAKSRTAAPTRTVLRRSKSIPSSGVPSPPSPGALSLIREFQEANLVAPVASEPRAKKLTRSKSQSLPCSRSPSPRRLKKKKKKVSGPPKKKVSAAVAVVDSAEAALLYSGKGKGKGKGGSGSGSGSAGGQAKLQS